MPFTNKRLMADRWQKPTASGLVVGVVAFVILFTAQTTRAGAPVLVLRDSQNSVNPFGTYFAEMMRGEGVMSFDEADRSDWASRADPAAMLASYKTIVTAEMDLTVPEQQLLRTYVQNGGTLISARPSQGLSDVFGIQVGSDRTEQYLQYFAVNPASPTTQGVTHGPLQYHGVAANYTLAGATPLAYLYDDAATASAHPAVTEASYGKGRAVAFAFDPATSVVLSRQGNPAWQNTEGDGVPEYRPHDMFTRTDGTTYYDPDRMWIPHADELQRVLSNVIISDSSIPLPRMWYLPGMHKTIIVNTGDGEDNYGAQFNQILDDAARYGGKFSVYLRDFGVANTSASLEAQWRAAGNEVGVHVYGDGADGAGAEEALTNAYGRVASALLDKFGHRALTARNHSIDWTGWVDMARIEAGYGTQLDTNYYHYLNTSVVNPLSANGYLTGSGLPQRFVDSDGALLGIYQAATQWPDEWFANAGLTAGQTTTIVESMLSRAESLGFYSAFVNNIHPVRYYGNDITYTWINNVWAYCHQHDIPMWSAEMLLNFTRARDNSKFLNVAYANGQLGFDFDFAGADRTDLTVMIPANWQADELSLITINGVPISWVLETIKGIDYVMFTPQLTSGHIVANFTAPLLAGDYNQDGRVDAGDYLVWRRTIGSSTNLAADGNGDHIVDDKDYAVWRAHFGNTRPGVAEQTAVPEPDPVAPLLVAVLSAILKLRQRTTVSPIWNSPCSVARC